MTERTWQEEDEKRIEAFNALAKPVVDETEPEGTDADDVQGLDVEEPEWNDDVLEG